MSSISIEITGLDKLLENINSFPESVQKEVGAEIQASAITIQGNAIKAAPIDLGGLRASIVYDKVDDLTATVVAGVNYAAYVEAGTGDFVSIPSLPPEASGILELARGAGLRRVNIHPQPYFFPAINDETPLLIQRVTTILSEIITT